MAEALRPLSTGELLDRTFALYKRNLFLFTGIILPAPALYLLFQLVQVYLLQRSPSRTSAGLRAAANTRLLWGFLAIGVVWIVGLAITHPATIRAVSAVHLGRPVSIRESYAALKGRVLRVIGIVFWWVLILLLGGIASFIALFIVGVVIATGAILLGIGSQMIGTVLGFGAVLGAIVGVLAIWGRYAIAIQACVVEDLGVFASLKRSQALLKGGIGRVIAVYALFVVLDIIIGFTIKYFVGLATGPLHSFQLTGVLTALGGFVAGILTGPLATVAMSLVYYDERVRKEAFDLQLMMAALDGPQASVAVSAG